MAGTVSASAGLGRCQPWKGYRVVGQGGESVVLLQRAGLQRVQVCHKPSGRRTYPEHDIGILTSGGLVGVQFVGAYLVYSWDSPEDDCGYSGLSLINTKASYDALLEIRTCGYSDDFDPVIVKRSATVLWAYRKAIYACEGLPRIPPRSAQ